MTVARKTVVRILNMTNIQSKIEMRIFLSFYIQITLLMVLFLEEPYNYLAKKTLAGQVCFVEGAVSCRLLWLRCGVSWLGVKMGENDHDKKYLLFSLVNRQRRNFDDENTVLHKYLSLAHYSLEVETTFVLVALPFDGAWNFCCCCRGC